MRGSSVHFKRISSAIHAVSHAIRDVPPEYLLPEGMSLGTHLVIDDHGQVQKLLEHKMNLASRQAKATKDYSPMWEGVINLPEPSSDVTPAQQIKIVKAWCVAYEKMTGHKVIRADVHLDEGFVDEAGKPHFNAHAHVMCDRTDDKGRVKKLTSTILREVQNMTAEVTTLQRGIDARQTGRKHIGHQNFRFDAEKNRIGLDKEKSKTARIQKLFADDTPIISGLKSEVSTLKGEAIGLLEHIAKLKAQYQLDREAMKATGEAKQKDYQALKVAHEKALADLTKAQTEVLKVPALEAQINALKPEAAKVVGLEKQVTDARKDTSDKAAEIARLNEQYRLDREALKASGEAKQADYQTLKKAHEAALADLAKAQIQAAKVPELVTQATGLQAEIDRLTPRVAQVPGLEAQVKAQAADLVATVTSQADQIAQIKAQYQLDREALKASGTATQQAYRALKIVYEAALVDLKTAQAEAAKVPALETKITQQAEAFDKLKADAMAIITPLRTEVKTMKTQITQLETDKLEADKTRFADMAKAYQNGKDAGIAAHLIVPGTTPAPVPSSIKTDVLTPAPMPREATRTASEAPKRPEVPIPPPTPQKSLVERLGASIKAMLGF